MNDLIDFLRARLDEDAQVARTAETANPGSAAKHWSAEQVDYCNPTTGLWGKAWGIVPAHVEGIALAVSPAEILPRVVRHIERHDPARVLAEVEAKRAIVDRSGLYARDLLKLLALPYADHPDYRDEWRP